MSVTTRQEKICIINGDDFGASTGINRGVIEAFTNGILTSASLMINMPGSDEAIALNAEYPELSVGLHVNFTNEGDPVIDLGDTEAARVELHRQYQHFVDRTGRPPTHIDSHHNIHRIATMRPLFLELSQRHDVLLREHSPVRYFSGFYGQWEGESHPEHISPAQLAHMLETEITPGFTELACHPGYMTDDFSSEYAVEREVELRSLCEPMVRQRARELGIVFVNYTQVRDLLRLQKAGNLES
jgi:predicted glycoside hydrolase/deacetylase ChbG (UPF0249 family)